MRYREEVRFLRWITLSLFSSLAQHSIRRVMLRNFYVSDLHMDDLEEFLLDGGNHLSGLGRGLLRGDENVPKHDGHGRHQIFLTQDTTLWLNSRTTHSEATGRLVTARLERGCWADLVGYEGGEGEFDEGLVAGCGWCRVRRTGAEGHRTIDIIHDTGRLESHGITSLTLDWISPKTNAIDLDTNGLWRFLHLVGAKLQELTLYNIGNATQPLVTALEACPWLSHLELWDLDADILWRIVDAYESGKCRATRLTLRHLTRSRGAADTVAFCDELSDPQRVISRVLVELCLEVDRDHIKQDAVVDEELTAMSDMLDRNLTLISFHVAGRSWCMRRFGGKSGQIVRQRVTARAKFAFLSVLDPRSTAGLETRGALSWLDCNVLRFILEMAAKPVQRQVLRLCSDSCPSHY